ncbi:MAG TPA: ferrous iron transport protein B [Clostridiales bacterium]|nr:ferrous iron transport protein B [Clostridiales bacterium]
MALRMAIAGNPNSGKTTLFNAITGSNARVGNWPGVTVEKKEGIYKKKVSGQTITLVDLPGIYSTSPYSPEGIIARNYILDEKPDIVINIVDATNLCRNLYLTTELLEIDIPMVIALNYIDVLEKDNVSFDVMVLENALGVKVIPISAHKKKGLDEIMNAAYKAAATKRQARSVLRRFSLGDSISKISSILRELNISSSDYIAIKLIEGDQLLLDSLNLNDDAKKNILDAINKIKKDHEDTEGLIADLRYDFITQNCQCAIKNSKKLKETTKTEKIDKTLTHKIWGLPIFFLIMFLMFFLVFGEFEIAGITVMMPGVLAAYGIEWVIAEIGELLARFLSFVNASDWAIGLVVDGIYGGVGAVFGFLPYILVMYLFISILEATGYMARAAFIMDRAFRKFGLSGKSFVPMLMGFGCSVPAVMGARTLENENERRLTILVTPFMSCGAKLPIWTFLTAAFFEGITATLVIFSIYVLGIIMAVITGVIFQKFVFKKQKTPFIMEMPPYRAPDVKTLLRILFEKFKSFAKKAGTIILVSSVIIWFLQSFSFSFKMVDNPNDSIMAKIGGIFAYIFKPMGFGTWQAAFAVLSGFVAKEVVVTTFGTLSGLGDPLENEGLMEQVKAWITSAGIFVSPLAAYCFMVFNLLAPPCLAAIGAISQEVKSKKWTAVILIYQLILAYLISLLIYGLGNLVMLII